MAVKIIKGEYYEYYSFLSRLCGGEVTGMAFKVHLDFLSRLCGGEVSNGGYTK